MMATLEHLNYIAKFKNEQVQSLTQEIAANLSQDSEGNICIGKDALPAVKKLVTFNDKLLKTQSTWLLFSLAANFSKDTHFCETKSSCSIIDTISQNIFYLNN